ncbi:MAG: rhomboid family intramembrane serine protease [Chitinivibrionales bacterium]|nr:rhomboid family intramembrane serine protease [Chitinivibrionales bacterium]
MFPLRDDNPTIHTPVITYVIIGINAAVWILIQGLGTQPALIKSVCNYGLIPGELLGTVPAGTQIPISKGVACTIDRSPDWFTLVSSMFMHGGWLHIIGNMWFLWVFGDNIEDTFGKVKYIIVYLLSGLVAAGAQIMINPSSTIPMVGASGAIGGIMGAYAVLFPRARVEMLVFLGFFITRIDVPAIFMLGYWFFIQLISALPTIGTATGGVAFWAHIGGFLAGIASVYVLGIKQKQKQDRG